MSSRSSPARNTTLIAIAMLASSFVMPFGSATNPANSGLFELDGNAQASAAAAGDDWSTLFPTNTSSSVYSTTFATDVPAGDTTYFSISSKDINDVSTWSATGNSAPDKDEITHAYAATYKTGGNSTTIYYGADRYAHNGDASIGFWFLQNNVAINAQGAFVGTHARNDTLIVSDFTNGGAIGNVSVYRWEPTGTNHLILVASGQDCQFVGANANLCARVNSASTPSPWSYTPKQGAAGSFPAQSFFEGGINLSAVYPNAPCFTNFLAETRSSQETTATLKDFVLHAFNNCPIVPPLSAFDLLKIEDADPINVGEKIGFNITLANGGPDVSFDTNLSDPLPPIAESWSIDGVWQIPSNNVSSGCAITGSPPTQTLTCAFGALAVFEGRAVHISATTAAAGDCALQTNTAFLTTNHNASQSQESTADVTVLCPDLSITKTADDASVSAGSDIGFTITVSNAGPGTATGATLNDPLPTGSGVTWSDDSADCDIAADSLTCDWGDIASGSSASVHVSSPTTFDSCGAYPNTATASSTNHPDVNASDTTTVLCPDLSITKTADDASVSAGADIGFTVTVSNGGPGVAAGVTLNDPLPTGSGVSWMDDSADCDIVADTLTCDFGDLASGASASVHVGSPTEFASCGLYDNTASANATNHGVLTASANTTAQCPDLSITKTADDATVSAGSDIGFTITVSNAGPGTATAVTLNDPLPTGSGVSWNDDSTDCDIAADTLTCDWGDLASGASASVHVGSGTTLDSCKAYENTANASATNHADVTATNTTTVLCPHLTLVKLADADTVSAGSDIGFTLWLNNTGDGTETNVTLNDPLPTGSGISWSVDFDSTDTACGIDINGTLVCDYGDLVSGATRSVHVTSSTTFDSCGLYHNVATAHNQETVTAEANTTVQCPDLSISKVADAASVEAGGSIGFVITVSNGGPGTATGTTLTDALPTGSGITWTDDSASCAIASNTLTCDFGDIASGGSASVHVTSPTDTSSCQAYPNTASANATNHAAVTASANTTVTCPVGNATRTIGFWATHTTYTEGVFSGNLSGVMLVGTGGHTRTIDTYGKLFGAFYSSIPYKTTGAKRGQPDQARMTLLQQLVAAKLNCAAFGCAPATQALIVSADAAYAGSDKAAMATYTALLDAFNNSGDSIGIGNSGSATPAASQAIANRVFWDSP